MPIDFDDLRYRGDSGDIKELYDSYRIENYLETYETGRRQQEEGFRQKLLRDAMRLTDRLSPRVFGIYRGVCEALDLDTTAEVFCIPDEGINAFAILDLQESGDYSLVAFTSGALEKLEDVEVASVLGHELGHFLFGNHRLNALMSDDMEDDSATILPPFGEALLLRWRKKSEISADRVGLIAGGDFYGASRALIKSTFGLSDKNLNLDIDALLAQIDEIKNRPELIEEAFASHPLLPIRLKALELFAQSEKANRNGFTSPSGEGLISDDQLEDSIDDMLRLSTRRPLKPLHIAVMNAVASGGVMVLGADGEVTDEEVKVLIRVLHKFFTDEPEEVVITDREANEKRLAEAIELVNRDGDDSDKGFILSRLADIAVADGALIEVEGVRIIEIAEKLKVPAKVAYSIMIGAAQSVGFQQDVKLNRIADSIRRALG